MFEVFRREPTRRWQSSETEIRKWKTTGLSREEILKKAFEIWINSDPNDYMQIMPSNSWTSFSWISSASIFTSHDGHWRLKIPSSSDESLRMPPQMGVTIFPWILNRTLYQQIQSIFGLSAVARLEPAVLWEDAYTRSRSLTTSQTLHFVQTDAWKDRLLIVTSDVTFLISDVITTSNSIKKFLSNNGQSSFMRIQATKVAHGFMYIDIKNQSGKTSKKDAS